MSCTTRLFLLFRIHYLLIEGRFGFPALGVSGAAVATVLGTVVAACISLTSVCRSGNFLKLTGYCGNLLQSEDLRALARLSRGIFTEQICKRMGLWMYAMLVARLGTENFAAHQISTNLLTLCFSIGDGLSIAAVSLIGQSLGAQQPKRAREYLTIIQRIGLACSALFSLLFFSCGQRIFSFFTNDPIIMAKGIVLLRFVAVIVFLQITQVIYFGCLRGAGDARYIAMVTFLCIAVLRPSLGALLCYGLGGGLYGAWTALVCEQICRLLLSWRRVKTGNWTKIEL